MQTKKFNFTEIEATCVELKSDANSDSVYYSAVYQYEVNNVIYTHYSKSKTTNTGIIIGETRTVFYNPNNPNEIYLGETESFILALGLFLIFCLGICIFSMFLNDSKIQNYLFVSFACLGLTIIIALFMSGGNTYSNFFDFIHHFPEFQFVLIFGYAGVFIIYLCLLHIISDLNCKVRNKNKRKLNK